MLLIIGPYPKYSSGSLNTIVFTKDFSSGGMTGLVRAVAYVSPFTFFRATENLKTFSNNALVPDTDREGLVTVTLNFFLVKKAAAISSVLLEGSNPSRFPVVTGLSIIVFPSGENKTAVA